MGIFYQAGPRFDYLKYLEHQSHFDRLQMSVSSDVRNLVASNEYLAKQNIKSIHKAGAEISGAIGQQTEELGSKLDAGFDRLSFDIGEVQQSVDRLATICETGFSQISLQLGRLDDGIDQLIAIAKTPEQTWAFEQFEIARDSFRRRLFLDALDYINRAITGHGDRPGYKLEHRFHYLRGLIHLGNEHNFDPEIVKPVLAIEDFKVAARYAEHVDNGGVARALQMAGWASYCAGDLPESERYLRDSLIVNEADLHTNYLLAKTLLRQGSVDNAECYFKAAMYGDTNYALRAGADPDFLDHKEALEGWIKYYRQNLIGECQRHYADLDLVDLRSKWPILVKYQVEPSNSKVDELEERIAQVPRAPLSTLLDLNTSIKSLVENCTEAVASAKSRLESKAESLANSKAVSSGINVDEASYRFSIIFGGLTFVLMFASLVLSGGLQMLLVALFIGSIAGGIAAFFVAPIVAIPLTTTFNFFSRAQKAAAHRKDSRSEREQVLADLRDLEE